MFGSFATGFAIFTDFLFGSVTGLRLSRYPTRTRYMTTLIPLYTRFVNGSPRRATIPTPAPQATSTPSATENVISVSMSLHMRYTNHVVLERRLIYSPFLIFSADGSRDILQGQDRSSTRPDVRHEDVGSR